MHLRENHIIQKIIDEKGNVLPDGEYGELVITTIGADAMPLIRYWTGDFTRILPQCPCGGVTKRIDTVSRRKGEISIEDLDSRLFAIPKLVDYRASFNGNLEPDILFTLIEQPIPVYDTMIQCFGIGISVCILRIYFSDRHGVPSFSVISAKRKWFLSYLVCVPCDCCLQKYSIKAMKNL